MTRTDSVHGVERSPATRWLLTDALAAVLVVAAILALMVIKFGPIDLALPALYGDDSPASFMYVKNLLLFGSPQINPTLGMPQGTDLYLYPSRDVVWIGLIDALRLWSRDPITVSNLYIFVGYAVNGLAFFACARLLGLGVPFAALGACVYAFSPFGLRSLMHHSLFPYPAAPIGATLALLMFYTPRHPVAALRPSLQTYRTWLPPALGAAIVGVSSIYWIAFTGLLVAVSAFCAALAARSWRPIAAAAVVLGLIGAVALAAWAPEIHSIARRFLASADSIAAVMAEPAKHAKETFSFPRSAAEQPTYGLRTLDMLLPAASHIPLLNKLAAPYHGWMRSANDGGNVIEGADSYLGFAGIAGLIAAGLVLCALVPGAGGRKPPFLRYRRQLIVGAAVNLVFAYVFAVSNGLGYAFNYLVVPFIRAQNRISVFVLFLALVVFYLVADNLMRRLQGRPVARAAVMALTIALSVGTIADATPGFTFRGAQAASAAAWFDDRDFFGRMQAALPRGSRILQLPVVEFPEAGRTVRMPDYEPIKGYLHTTGFLWSYGAMKQSPQLLWQLQKFSEVPADTLVANAVAAGFDAILIERRGFADDGAAVIAGLTDRLGAPAVVLRSGTRVLIDLRPRPGPRGGG